MSLSVSVTAGYLAQDGQPVTPAQLRLIAVPTIQLLGTINATSISDGAITPAKLNTSVAGAGLTGGGGSALSVVTDNATVDINGSNQVEVKDAGLQLRKLGFGAFAPASPYGAGIHGLVPAPPASKTRQFLRDDGTWQDVVGQAVAQAANSNTGLAVFNALNFK